MQSLFPKDFFWGAASAAAQVEGAYLEDGKCASVWDNAPDGKIKNQETCHEACDHYHRYKEDVAMMKEMGLKSYRFSVSWARVMPEAGKINEKGLAFYKDLVSELRKAGIEPMVTLFHWDTPQWMMDLGGWRVSEVCDYFAQYVRAVVEALSDQVQWWMTMNEPSCFITLGYVTGGHAPFLHEPENLPVLTKNCMVCHARAVEILRKEAKTPAKVGIAMATSAFVPKGDTEEEVANARYETFEGSGRLGNAWWMDPILLGQGVKTEEGYQTDAETLDSIHPALDFVGINVYTPQNCDVWSGNRLLYYPGCPRNSMGWPVEGRVMYYTIKFIYERYGLPVMVSENGMSDNDFPCLDGKVHDPQRIDYITRYLRNVNKAMAEGVPVIGYQYWSIMDNFEWAEGYDPRFGLVYVDYRDQTRIVKDSGWFYREVIRTNGEVLFDKLPSAE